MSERRFEPSFCFSNFRTYCRKVKAAGREQPVPERHVFPNNATSSRFSSLPLHLRCVRQQRTKQDSSLFQCVCVGIVRRVCVWGLCVQAQTIDIRKVHEEERVASSQSRPGTQAIPQSVFFFVRESPWPSLLEILVSLRLSKGLLATTITMLWPTDVHDICSGFTEN